MNSLMSLICKYCDVRRLSFMKTRQYSTKSIAALLSTSMSPDSTETTRPIVHTGALDKIVDGGDLHFRLLLNMYNGFLMFITRFIRVLPPGHDRCLCGPLSISVNCSGRILCPCKSNNNSTFRVRSSNNPLWFASHQCLICFEMKTACL